MIFNKKMKKENLVITELDENTINLTNEKQDKSKEERLEQLAYQLQRKEYQKELAKQNTNKDKEKAYWMIDQINTVIQWERILRLFANITSNKETNLIRANLLYFAQKLGLVWDGFITNDESNSFSVRLDWTKWYNDTQKSSYEQSHTRLMNDFLSCNLQLGFYVAENKRKIGFDYFAVLWQALKIPLTKKEIDLLHKKVFKKLNGLNWDYKSTPPPSIVINASVTLANIIFKKLKNVIAKLDTFGVFKPVKWIYNFNTNYMHIKELRNNYSGLNYIAAGSIETLVGNDIYTLHPASLIFKIKDKPGYCLIAWDDLVCNNLLSVQSLTDEQATKIMQDYENKVQRLVKNSSFVTNLEEKQQQAENTNQTKTR